jgi:hypothetical protein
MFCREHELGDDIICSTTADGPQGSVVIPTQSILKLTAAEIGQKVLSLIDASHATKLLQEVESFSYGWPYYGGRSDSEPWRRHSAVCMSLSHDDGKEGGELYCYRRLASVRHLDEDLDASYRWMRDIFIDAWIYLRTKKSKLTSTQKRASKVLEELVSGCSLCGMIEDSHSVGCPRGR